jgi:NAD(P)-dependent dehydrogenase (short-subunit alcohol dehydrogenase family)
MSTSNNSEKSDIFSLKDKVVLVTGSVGLLGLQMCETLCEYDAHVVMTDINKKKLIRESTKLGKKFPGKVLGIYIDIVDEKSVQDGLKKTLDMSRSVDVLINNAYPYNKHYGRLYEDIEFKDWRENVDMHLNGYFNVTHKVSMVMMKQKRGNIINIASIYGVLGPHFDIYKGLGFTMPSEYSAIKGGIINFTRYLATYLARYNIRVNSISPGGIYDGQSPSFVKRYCEEVPLGRMASPSDIVGGVIYLASEASSYVTGQNLMIDGGWSTW